MGREQISSLTWSSGVGQVLWGTQTAKFLSPDDYVNDLHVDANARPQGHLKGLVKIILLPVIALSFPHFCPKLEQTLHIHQGQHS